MFVPKEQAEIQSEIAAEEEQDDKENPIPTTVKKPLPDPESCRR